MNLLAHPHTMDEVIERELRGEEFARDPMPRTRAQYELWVANLPARACKFKLDKDHVTYTLRSEHDWDYRNRLITSQTPVSLIKLRYRQFEVTPLPPPPPVSISARDDPLGDFKRKLLKNPDIVSGLHELIGSAEWTSALEAKRVLTRALMELGLDGTQENMIADIFYDALSEFGTRLELHATEIKNHETRRVSILTAQSEYKQLQEARLFTIEQQKQRDRLVCAIIRLTSDTMPLFTDMNDSTTLQWIKWQAG